MVVKHGVIARCDRCHEVATWVRVTQFAGSHPFCEPHARAEADFGHAMWRQLTVGEQTTSKVDTPAVCPHTNEKIVCQQCGKKMQTLLDWVDHVSKQHHGWQQLSVARKELAG